MYDLFIYNQIYFTPVKVHEKNFPLDIGTNDSVHEMMTTDPLWEDDKLPHFTPCENHG